MCGIFNFRNEVYTLDGVLVLVAAPKDMELTGFRYPSYRHILIIYFEIKDSWLGIQGI